MLDRILFRKFSTDVCRLFAREDRSLVCPLAQIQATIEASIEQLVQHVKALKNKESRGIKTYTPTT
jgi:hypothetical protein